MLLILELQGTVQPLAGGQVSATEVTAGPKGNQG